MSAASATTNSQCVPQPPLPSEPPAALTDTNGFENWSGYWAKDGWYWDPATSQWQAITAQPPAQAQAYAQPYYPHAQQQPQVQWPAQQYGQQQQQAWGYQYGQQQWAQQQQHAWQQQPQQQQQQHQAVAGPQPHAVTFPGQASAAQQPRPSSTVTMPHLRMQEQASRSRAAQGAGSADMVASAAANALTRAAQRGFSVKAQPPKPKAPAYVQVPAAGACKPSPAAIVTYGPAAAAVLGQRTDKPAFNKDGTPLSLADFTGRVFMELAAMPADEKKRVQDALRKLVTDLKAAMRFVGFPFDKIDVAAWIGEKLADMGAAPASNPIVAAAQAAAAGWTKDGMLAARAKAATHVPPGAQLPGGGRAWGSSAAPPASPSLDRDSRRSGERRRRKRSRSSDSSGSSSSAHYSSRTALPPPALNKKQRRAVAKAQRRAARGRPTPQLARYEKWLRPQSPVSGSDTNSDERHRRAERASRFQRAGSPGVSTQGPALEQALDAFDWSTHIVVGTCTTLEKRYLRLTTAPRPSDVRPPPVLRQALDRLCRLAAAKDVDYFYLEDQFKAMRQDATVQHLRDELTVAIYEAHGRAALEYGDWQGFNQCQAQLHALYAAGAPGCRDEWLAYRLLYQAQFAGRREGRGVAQTMLAVPVQMRAAPAVVHALQVRTALAARDHLVLWRLYAAAPKLGALVLDHSLDRVRLATARQAAAAFKAPAGGGLPLPAAARLLGFLLPEEQLRDGRHAGSRHRSASTAAAAGMQALEIAGSSPGGSAAVGEAARPGGAGGVDPVTRGPAADVHMQGGAGGGTAHAAQPLLPGCSSAEPDHRAGMQSDTEAACAACLDWLHEHSAVVTLPDKGAPASAAVLDCQSSLAALKAPVRKAAVAHGDANLDISSFLKSVTA